jgi:hypothetical protein
MVWNWPHVHLMVNHVPVLGVPFALALLAAGAWLRSGILQRAAAVALVVTALAVPLVFLSGDEASDALDKRPGFDAVLAGDHEDAAELASWAMGGLGLLSAGLLVATRKQPAIPRVWLAVLLVAGIAVAGLFARAATLGGRIAHPEIRPGGATGIPGAPS